jgi:protein-tyrosine-phosphatase/DNA-binding transcriptional ArsR family regulator
MSVQPLPSTVSPPPFLQLAGHPLRWRLLSELARSDRSVAELTGLVGEPQNLVSYHLRKLKGGRLVSGRRSSADGRDTYYGLDLAGVGDQLSAAGGALHPGLRLGPPAQTKPTGERAPGRPARVLFLCTGNSARSQMAEALATALSDGAVEAFSAGSHPKPLHPNAVRVMVEQHDLDLSGHVSKSMDLFEGQLFDWVISLCDRVKEVCPDFEGRPEVVHWSIPNPATGEPDAVTYPLFRQTAAELASRVVFLLASISERAGRSKPEGESHE